MSPLRLLQVTTLVSTLDRFAMPPMLVAIAVSLDVPLAQVVTAAGEGSAAAIAMNNDLVEEDLAGAVATFGAA